MLNWQESFVDEIVSTELLSYIAKALILSNAVLAILPDGLKA